ncbi:MULTISPECIES: hypothetical protein [unclassified Pseudomonas]|nr:MULTISPECIES: hypothetical protein [unclassified Pseudomonas]
MQLPLLNGEISSYRLTNDLTMAIWLRGFSTQYSLAVVLVSRVVVFIFGS